MLSKSFLQLFSNILVSFNYVPDKSYLVHHSPLSVTYLGDNSGEYFYFRGYDSFSNFDVTVYSIKIYDLVKDPNFITALTSEVFSTFTKDQIGDMIKSFYGRVDSQYLEKLKEFELKYISENLTALRSFYMNLFSSLYSNKDRLKVLELISQYY